MCVSYCADVCVLLHCAECVCTVWCTNACVRVCIRAYRCVCRSVGFGAVTVDSLGGMSITHCTVVSYKENKKEGRRDGRAEGGPGGGGTALIFFFFKGGWVKGLMEKKKSPINSEYTKCKY